MTNPCPNLPPMMQPIPARAASWPNGLGYDMPAQGGGEWQMCRPPSGLMYACYFEPGDRVATAVGIGATADEALTRAARVER